MATPRIEPMVKDVDTALATADALWRETVSAQGATSADSRHAWKVLEDLEYLRQRIARYRELLPAIHPWYRAR